MALYTQSEFASLCEMSPANLSTYKKRGKITLTDNMVDDSLLINADFLAKRLSKKGKLKSEIQNNQPEIVQNSTENDTILETKREKITSITDKPGGEVSLHLLEKQKKELDIQKTAEEIELLKKKNEKMEGELIPTELVKSLLLLHFTSATNAFKNSIEKTLTEWSKRKDFSREEMADLRGSMTKNVNAAISDSVKESKSQLSRIVDEFIYKKGVGERK